MNAIQNNAAIAVFFRPLSLLRVIIMEMMDKHSSFETIYRATFTTLSKHVYFKLAQLSDAEDLIQEVYMDYYRYIHAQNKSVANVQAYLLQIANNKLSHYYKEKMMRFLNEHDEHVLDQVKDPFNVEHNILDQVTLEQIFIEIMNFDEIDQHILLGYYRFGLNFRELSEKLKIPESTIKSRAAKLIEKLRVKYK